MKRNILAIALAVFVLGEIATAAVDLVTVPRREGTQLTIYNSEDITMVREQRMLTVKRGANRIQFTWANTLIDPTSIDFRILDHVDKVVLLDTTFPSGRNDALQWNIRSDLDGKIPVEIRYFTSGITWKADYVGIANQEETTMDVTGYVRVINNSGELYDNAQVRLVVGKINLVEKIADLARRGPPRTTARPGTVTFGGVANGEVFEGLEEAMDREKSSVALGPGGGMPVRKAPEVQKQGLSEYFLFTIAGREDIESGTPKRLVALDVEEVPLESVYKLSDRSNPSAFTKYYRFTNEKLTDENGDEKKLPGMENLGLSPLPDGNVRLFFEYPTKDLAYVGGTGTKYVPIGDRVEVNVGQDPDITIVRRLKNRVVSNVVARQYKRITSRTYVELYDLIDYDETFVIEEEIISGKASDAMVEVERRFNANVYLWGSDEKPAEWDGDEQAAYVDMHTTEGRIERVDQNHVKYFLDMKPGERRVVTYTVTHKQRKIGPKLNVVSQRETNNTIPADQSETAPNPVNPIPPIQLPGVSY